ncbi:hypothetical protein PAPHI01_2284 [Pancytospora philotis]|nr:hypothetical protein PAPHI01_2284 [Pancytospora philotis]
MDARVEAALDSPVLETQAAVKTFLRETRGLIDAYERELYESEALDKAAEARIRAWRARLLAIVRENKDRPDGDAPAGTDEGPEDREGLDTLKMLNRQLLVAETNQRLLERGTLKLVGLSYSCTDIEQAIIDARKKMSEGRSKERVERRNLLLSFIFFICVCIFILVDKCRAKFAGRPAPVYTKPPSDLL